MGCVAGVEHVETKTIWQIRPEQSFDALEQGELRDLGSSFDIWSWHHLKGPGPPNRQLHDKHLRSLDAFLIKVEKTPSTLQTLLMKKRCNEVSPEKVKEVTRVKKVKEVNGVKEVEDLMVSIAF